MADVSVFADESGEQGFQSKYYALTLVFHKKVRKHQLLLR